MEFQANKCVCNTYPYHKQFFEFHKDKYGALNTDKIINNLNNQCNKSDQVVGSVFLGIGIAFINPIIGILTFAVLCPESSQAEKIAERNYKIFHRYYEVQQNNIMKEYISAGIKKVSE